MRILLASAVVVLCADGCGRSTGPGSVEESRTITTEALLGPWLDQSGNPVLDGVTKVDNEFPLLLHVQRGPGHCDWEDALLMSLTLPVGRVAVQFDDDVYQYVRDPKGVVAQRLRTRLDTDSELPDSAQFSGFSTGDIELWLDPATVEQFVFITDGRTSEQWPRANPPALCG